MGIARRVLDSLTNVVSGLGGGADKAAFTQYAFSVITQQDVEASYRTSWLCRKITDLPPYDMTRAWRGWQAEGTEIEAIEAAERVFDLPRKVRTALSLARLYGGAALVMGVNGDDPALPLDLNAVKFGSLRYIHVLSRYQLFIGGLVTDPEDPHFLAPAYYQVTAAMAANTVLIHPSRVIPFHGQSLPQGSLLQGAINGDLFWGDPLMQTIQDAVKNADLTPAAIAQLVHEAKVDVINIPGMMDQIGTAAYEAQLMRRLNVASMMKSVTNALVLDGEEEWSSKTVNFTGLPDVARLFLSIAAGAADIPATRLLGQSPQGMNATGESDLRNYYDMLSSRQNTDLRPTLAPLDEVLIRTATGMRSPDVHFTFGSLWQLSATEKATVDKQTADTAMVWVNTGLIPSEALATGAQNRLVDDGTFPGLDGALADAKAAGDLPEILEEPEPVAVDPLALPAAGTSNVVPLKKAAADVRAELERIAKRDGLSVVELQDALGTEV